jgi:hypothetical protein
MGDMGEYWRDVKDHYRKKQKKYENKIYSTYAYLCSVSSLVGDHHRYGEWDFWHTGTVRNIKTGKRISMEQLKDLIKKEESFYV